jgi:hypothetical protein
MTPKKVIAQNWLCWKAGLAIAVLLTWLAPHTQAASRFDVFLGYDSMLPDHGWFPITCEVQNDGPSYNAVIEVSIQQMGSAQTRRVQVDLPKGTLKRVVIPVFTAALSWNVRLLDEHGRVRSEQTMMQAKILPADLPMVAGLCRTVQGLPTFPQLPGRFQNASMPTAYRAARLEPALFPDNPLPMESIDLLYLNSQKALELSEPQAAAIMAWLQSGGHLVVGVEQISDITGSRWLQSLMPCDLTSAGSLTNHAELEEWLHNWRLDAPRSQVARGPTVIPPRNSGPGRGGPARGANSIMTNAASPLTIQDDPSFDSAPLPYLTGALRDGTVLIGSDDAPLAVTANRGRGRITVLLFSPEREPFISWSNRPLFWAKLAGIPRERFEPGVNNQNMTHMGSDGIFGAMIDSKQVRKLPLSWLLLLLVAYLAVIGPLDQYVLKKLNRQMLTWITFPLYVVAFSGLIYLIGFHLRAGELEWNELNIVDVLSGTERPVLRGETYVSIYSPVNHSYKMESRQPYATLRGEYGATYGVGTHESSEVSVLQTGNNFQAEASVPVWTSQLFVSEWLQGSPQPPLEMTAAKTSSGDWSITVVNNTESELPHAKAVLGGHIFDLGPLAAHQTKATNFNISQGTTAASFSGKYIDSFRNAVNQRHQSFGNNNNNIGDPIEASMAACFLSLAEQPSPQPNQNYYGMPGDFTVYRNLDLGRFANADHAILLAWYPDHSLVDGLNRFQVTRTHRNTLLRLVVPIKTSGAPATPDNNPKT